MTPTPATKLVLTDTKPAATAGDALIVLVAPGRGKSLEVHGEGLTGAQTTRITDALRSVGFTANAGEVTRIPAPTGIKAPTLVGVGIGNFRKKPDLESLRRAVGSAVRALSGSRKVALLCPADLAELREIALAARLAAYAFTSFRIKSYKKGTIPPPRILLVVPGPATRAQKAVVDEVNIIGSAVALTRDLVNTPPNSLNPAGLAQAAEDAVTDLPVVVTIWDEVALERDGCGGILAVGQGSANPPRLVRMDYAPDGATAHLALVGKGITFDTGGISIKPAANMDEMKGDMGGAAAVLGAVKAIAELRLPIRVTGWLPTAENMPSGTAQRPGDVIHMYDGTTVEVLNTDAEGRLVLADALGMAVADKPDLIIDVATLTGAQRIALGSRIAGVMSNNAAARTQVCDAAERAGEDAWPMPLPVDLRASLDSDTADVANIGDRLGGMLAAGVFLNEFVPPAQAWVHMDIAGPSFNEKAAYGYTPKGGTGAAVRTLVQVAAEMARGSS